MNTNQRDQTTLKAGENYRYWQDSAKDLLRPLAALMEEGKAALDIHGQASDHDLNADRLESYARPFLLFVHWENSLRHASDGDDRDLAESMRAWFRSGLLAGSDPKSQEFWGHSANFHQHSVEMGVMVIGLELSRNWLWDTFSDEERSQVLSWLESDAGNGHHWNNHMFFGIFVMEFLLKEGRGFPSYRAVIDRWFDELDGMYQGDGWYMDGMNQAFDYYNAYAWHFYTQWWTILYGDANPERCERFSGRTREFLDTYRRFFAPSGEHPAFGRSIPYRFNATAPFGLAARLGSLPIEPSSARGLCQRSLKFFLDKPIAQDQGCLSLGWHDEFPEVGEVYSCGGSPYWAAKAFAPLLLDSGHAFWNEETAADSADFEPIAMPVPCLVVRPVHGEVELLNAGSQIASTNTRFGPWKWGLLSYKSDYGFTVAKIPDGYPLDGGLTASGDEGLVFGRHYTAPVAIESDHMACLYSLGRKHEQFQISVETHVWWKSGWQLIVHRFISKQPTTLTHGSYALSSRSGKAFSMTGDFPYQRIEADGRGVALQSICGYDEAGRDERLSENHGPRRHMQAPFHATCLLRRALPEASSGLLACLSWSGPDGTESQPWTIVSLDEGCWRMRHDELGVWEAKASVLTKQEIT